MSFLEIDRVSFTYPGWPPVVRDVDWQIQQGDFHCLVGRSGCGKTTLLKLAAGLLPPRTGSIRLQGTKVVAPGPQTGFVFQAPVLLDWHRVIDNVLLPVALRHKPGAHEIDKARQLLDLLGLQAHAQHYPRQLSGGQQSRVALARALILDPALLLLDEPFAALDAITRGELQDDLLRMCNLGRTTVLFVTHDIAEAVYLSDRIAVMSGGQIVQNIRVDVAHPRSPQMRYEAAFNQQCDTVRVAMGSETA